MAAHCNLSKGEGGERVRCKGEGRGEGEMQGRGEERVRCKGEGRGESEMQGRGEGRE